LPESFIARTTKKKFADLATLGTVTAPCTMYPGGIELGAVVAAAFDDVLITRFAGVSVTVVTEIPRTVAEDRIVALTA